MKKVKRKLVSIITVVLITLGGLAAVNAACLNDPGNNDGDCISDQYGNDFCEDSWAWHDCVQGYF
ncbi:hypothetical protein [Fodinibius halophilus]|uniref:Uncharacterized protein n=1 Tax=Fodinibius halophilus TaxID=1736908 RepID=A0A6M1T294_9BACT|nr:hypothetical protein [Fodinibius halophilus]NGP88119.1 hypothetical protein [Fodinibius halophilus]